MHYRRGRRLAEMTYVRIVLLEHHQKEKRGYFCLLFAPLWMGNSIGISMGKGEMDWWMDWRRDWRFISDVQRA